PLAQHQRSFRRAEGGFVKTGQQLAVNEWRVAGQYHQPLVAGGGEPGADAGQGAGEISLLVAHQLIGEVGVLLMVAVAGDDQVVRQRARHGMQPTDEGLAAPDDESLVLSSHAATAAAGQEQYRAGRQWSLDHGRVPSKSAVI